MIKGNKKPILTLMALFSMTGLLWSCKDDDLSFNTHDEAADIIVIGAKVKESVQSRAYEINGGSVKEGSFTLSYPVSLSTLTPSATNPIPVGSQRHNFNFGTVTFGNGGIEETGFVNIGKNGNITELKWSNIYTGSLLPFYIDNVKMTENPTSATSDTIVSWSNLNGPFNAAPFNYNYDYNTGGNDLLWGGMTNVKRNSPVINLEMHHNMARVRIKVEVTDAETGQLGTDLKGAKVYISNVLQKPEKFNRRSGELLFPITAVGENLMFVDDREDGEAPKWNISHDVNSDGKAETIYESVDFVIPPQQFGIDRPRMYIYVPAKQVGSYDPEDKTEPGDDEWIEFSGALPGGMVSTVYDENGHAYEKGDILSFKKEHVLTINTRLDPENLELEFIAIVEEWVDKGEFTPTGKQSGMYNKDEFNDLIKYYNDNDAFRLNKYGYRDANGKWIFSFWKGDITLTQEDIQGTMQPGGVEELPQYSFNFRNYTLKLNKLDGTVQNLYGTEGQTSLYDMVSEDRPATPAVSTSDDFKKLYEAYQKQQWQISNYGTYNREEKTGDPDTDTEEEGTWIFKFDQDLTLDYDEIVSQMIYVASDGSKDFAFDLGDHSITLTHVPDDIESPLTEEEGANTLREIVTKEIPGIYNTSDFYAVLDALKNNNESTLLKYGEQTIEGVWTFPLWRNNINLEWEKIQGALVNSDYKLDDINFNFKGYDVGTTKKNFQKVVFNGSKGVEELKEILFYPEFEGIKSLTDFSSLIKTVEDSEAETDDAIKELWKYGYYDDRSGVKHWVFEIKSDIKISDHKLLSGCLKNIKGTTFSFDLSYYTVTVTRVTDTSSTVYELREDAGAKKLYHLLYGTNTWYNQ